MAGLNLALPFLIVNMGGEMIYILNQRLLAQKIPVDKADKVRSDVIRHLFSEEFIRELISPQSLYSMTSTRQVFDKIAQSSIMKLQTSSMNKLFDLMLMGVKMQILNLAYPEQLLKLTLNHIQELIGLTSIKECVNLLNGTCEKLVKVYSNLGSATFNRIKQALLRFFQNRQVKVTMFLHNNLQLNDGTIKIPTTEGVPQSEVPGKVILGKAESHKAMLNTQKFKRSSLSTRHPLQANTALGTNLYDCEKPVITEEETKLNPFPSSADKNRGAVAKWELDSLANMIRAKDEEPENVSISLFNDIEIEVKEQAHNEVASVVNNSHIQKFVAGFEESKGSGEKVEDQDDDLLGLL